MPALIDMMYVAQILFNGEFYIESSAKVHTPHLSTIYGLGINEIGPTGADFKQRVDLVVKNWHQILAELRRWKAVVPITLPVKL